MKKFVKWVVFIVVLGVVIGGGAWVYENREMLADEWTIRENPPSAEITAIAAKDDLTELGARIFYASRPSVVDASEFNAKCVSAEQTAIVLGCYVSKTIYLYNISDSRVADAKYFTAAHEMLHAAYERLDSATKKTVNGWLEAEYKKLNDADLNTRMANYAKTEPGEEDNELHSILGTEFANLSPDLENYYARYFKNQDVVAGIAADYKKVWSSIEDQRDALKNKMSSLNSEISSLSATYSAAASKLSADVASFNKCAGTTNCFASEDAFGSARAALVARQNALATNLATINSKITEYNDLVKKYNNLGGEAKDLENALNSKVNTKISS